MSNFIQDMRRRVLWLLFGNKPHLVNRLSGALRDKIHWDLFFHQLKREHIFNKNFDAEHGTDTADEIRDLESIGVPKDSARRGSHYRAFWAQHFFDIMETFKDARIDFSKFTFVDYGSGKGKVILLATNFLFARIEGIEYSNYLHDIAIMNCSVYTNARQQCFDIAPILIDALDYDPPQGPFIAFLFNPFDVATTECVLRNIEMSVEKTHRDVYVVYANLRTINEGLSSFGRLRLLKPMIVRPTFIIYYNSGGATGYAVG